MNSFYFNCIFKYLVSLKVFIVNMYVMKYIVNIVLNNIDICMVGSYSFKS